MSLAVKHIDHVEVFVRNLDDAAHWYAEVLGLQEIYRWAPEPVMIGAGDTKLALFHAAPDARGIPGGESATMAGWHRVAWRTDRDGFELFQKHLTKLGIGFRGPIDHRIAWSIYFQDRDGNPLEITYYVHGNRA